MPDNQNFVTPIPGVENLTYEQVNTIINFEKLWIEFVLWMRSFIRSSLYNLPDLTSVNVRVFQQLPRDFYNEFSNYFSPVDSQQFIDLFSRLLVRNWQLVNAYKSNDKTAIEASTIQWYQIADELATFLASVNKYWDVNKLKTILYEYVQLKIQEITAFQEGKYDQETKLFDEVEEKAIQLANYMAMGIIANQSQTQPQTRCFWTGIKQVL